MRFSELMQSARRGDGRIAVDVGDDWLQGRSVFGGLQAAIGVAAMRTLVPALPLRTLQVTFMAPVPGGEVLAEATVLRVGKSATHAEAHLLAGSARLATMIGVFGEGRASQVSHRPAQVGVSQPAARSMPYVAGITPEFTRHFSGRWLRGDLPFSASASRETVVAVDMIDAGNASEGHLLAIADFIPPVALSLLRTPAPGSSMTWMLELLLDDVERQPLSGWRVDSEMVAAGSGYTSQSNRIWAPDGRLAALSRQSMVIFG
jgi:acyl-CoA thioesterase